MKGYKVFKPGFTSQHGDMVFKVGEEYKHEGKIALCNSGFHFCEKLIDCYRYYSADPSNRIAEVEALGEVITEEDGGKSVTNHIKIIRELTWDDALSLTNSGRANTSVGNTGDCNTGDYNTGYRNTGYRNTGDCNTGDCNTGDCNTGDCNTGDCNTGDCNTGDCNTGDRNTGYRNTGDCNTGDYNTGVFCQDKNPTIRFFDKESDWTYQRWVDSRARYLLRKVPYYTTERISESNMNDEEKTKHPEAHVTGGYLKRHENSGEYHWDEWWEKLSVSDKQVIKDLPNWNTEDWKTLTGIEATE